MELKKIGFSEIIQDFSFSSRASSLGIIGPSGCGKTTLLRLLAGLESYSGEIKVPSLTMAFQEARLIPWLSVKENLELVINEDVDIWLERVGLAQDRDKYPGELSGGMAQRLNLARALAAPGDMVILDEPFTGIDQARKRELKKLIKERKFIMVTHDISDALDMCEEIIVVEGPPLRLVEYFPQTMGIDEKLVARLEKLTS